MASPHEVSGPWVTVLEFAASESSDALLSISQLDALLARLASSDPVSLYSQDRYVVQLRSPWRSAARAFSHAVAQHDHAVTALGLPKLPLVRAEVMTADELARDMDAARHGGPPSLHEGVIAPMACSTPPQQRVGKGDAP